VLPVSAINDKRLTAKDLAAQFKVALNEEETLLKNIPGRSHILSKKLRGVRPHQDLRGALDGFDLSKVQGESPGDFEKDITDLVMGVMQGGLTSSPFASAVKNITDLVNNEMKPAVIEAHNKDQDDLNNYHGIIVNCSVVKDQELPLADLHRDEYLKNSTAHKACRLVEESSYNDNVACHDEWRTLREDMNLKCQSYLDTEERYVNVVNNQAIMGLQPGPEEAEGYVSRVTDEICGQPFDCSVCGTDAEPAERSMWHGRLDDLLHHKDLCETARANVEAKRLLCVGWDNTYHTNRSNCDNIQDVMDLEACHWATMTNDACQKYDECHSGSQEAYLGFESDVVQQETDRKAEWHGLERLNCIIAAYDSHYSGNATKDEAMAAVDACQTELIITTTHLDIIYPGVPALVDCLVNQSYPSGDLWVDREFTPLPANAKGKEDATCAGMTFISTDPNPASTEEGCVCERLVLTGPYSPGPLVRCTDCTDVYKASQTNSCPDGTKIFAPRSHDDWTTFLSSADPNNVRSPNFIIDITRPRDGCGALCAVPAEEGTEEEGTETAPMNIESIQTLVADRNERWVTKDGGHWWLRSTNYFAPTAEYKANCYMDVWGSPYGQYDENGGWIKPIDADSITFNTGGDGCSYHSRSYYCQLQDVSLKPKAGSPSSCICKAVVHKGTYSAGQLIKCQKCLDVYKSLQKNSCPPGTKIFSPRTREDWTTFIASATPLKAPHWIIDITRSTDGCGTCSNHSMNSDTANQGTWHTKDNSAWWLKNTAYAQPSGDYEANCYMALTGTPASADDIAFDDDYCNVHSRSYYCQTATTTTTTTTTIAATCDTLYVDANCPSGKTKEPGVGEPVASCAGNPCVQGSADDDTCCAPKAKCDSYYTVDMCPDGHELVDNPSETECTTYECPDNADNDNLCCQAIPEAEPAAMESGWSFLSFEQ